ncbi:MAG TPA: prolyl oligopeptidase family serine peptidase, partial [Chroococcales cyanobacterium]
MAFKKPLSDLFAALLLVGAVCAPASLADLPPLIPRKVLFGDAEREQPDISPDGKYLVYSAPNKNRVHNVWLRTIGKNDDHMITDAHKGELAGPWWQWDGRHIIYSQDFDGDENWHFYQTDIATRVTRDLTPFQGARATMIALDQKYPNRLLITLNTRDSRYNDAYEVNLTDGAIKLLVKNPGDVDHWTADRNLQIRAATAITKKGITEVRVRDTINSPWRTLISWGPEDEGDIVGFSADNRSLLLTSSVGANTKRLLKLDLLSKKQSVLAEDSTFDIAGVLTDPKTHKLEAVSVIKDRPRWQVLDSSLKGEFAKLESMGGTIWIGNKTRANDKWIVSVSSDTDYPAYYLFDRATGKTDFLYKSRPAFSNYILSKMQSIDITARDGTILHSYLTLPVGVEPKHLPAVIDVHGGPWSRNVWGFSNTAQWLANRGYVVLQVNFRGSTGYGKKFVNAGDRQWGAKMNTDIIDAKDWLVAKGYADPGKVCISGSSYGGYETLAAA